MEYNLIFCVISANTFRSQWHIPPAQRPDVSPPTHTLIQPVYRPVPAMMKSIPSLVVLYRRSSCFDSYLHQRWNSDCCWRSCWISGRPRGCWMKKKTPYCYYYCCCCNYCCCGSAWVSPRNLWRHRCVSSRHDYRWFCAAFPGS